MTGYKPLMMKQCCTEDSTNIQTRLSDIPVAGNYEITQICGVDVTCERLIEMGFRVGMRIDFISQAPLNGPLICRFQNTILALRIEEAQCLLIRK